MKNFQNWFIAIAAITIHVLSHYRWNIPELAWIGTSFWLLLLLKNPYQPDSGRGHIIKTGLLLFALVQVAWNLQILKIITWPIPWFVAPAFAIPMGMLFYVGLVCWYFMQRRLSIPLSISSWVAISVILDWALFRLTPFGMWGTVAASQGDRLEVLQLASVGGITLITAAMSFTSVVFAYLLAGKFNSNWKSAITVGFVIVVVFAFGHYRLANVNSKDISSVPSVLVGGVTTDIHLVGNQLPNPEELKKGTQQLFDRSTELSNQGARVVVWNEGATAISKSAEHELIAQGKAWSSAHKSDLVMAYIVILQDQPLTYDNKYVWISDGGDVLQTYSKHYPVPGEPMSAGTSAIEVLQRPYGNAAGAICYDYDFPQLARAHARQKATLIFLPSSDWQGIQPYHADMSRIRAIEGGFSLIRPVRWATSMAYDAYGRQLAKTDYFDNQRTILVNLPSVHVPTLYSRLGDWPVYLAFLLVSAVLFRRLFQQFSESSSSKRSMPLASQPYKVLSERTE